MSRTRDRSLGAISFGLYANAHRRKVRKVQPDKHPFIIIEEESLRIRRRGWPEMVCWGHVTNSLEFGTCPHFIDILNQNPNFVDPNNNDFRLQPNSIAIDRGDSLLNVSYDIIGVSRPQGPKWDTGAYEYFTGGIEEKCPAERYSKKNLIIKPNPFINTTQITGIEDEKIFVYDITGRFLYISPASSIGEDLKRGIYFIGVANKFYKIIKIE